MLINESKLLPRVLIGTLYSGEPQKKRCLKSISLQEEVYIHSFLIENLPNKLAHEKLYSKFQNEVKNFDFFVKLDADMILHDPLAIKKAIGVFHDKKIDHVVFPIYDWFTRDSIYGIHVFRSNVKWVEISSKLFVDPDPVINGKKVIKPIYDQTINVSHGLNASSSQNYLFGYHRALKLVQRVGNKNISQSYNQFKVLRKAFNICLSKKNTKRIYIIFAADDVLFGFKKNENNLINKHLIEKLILTQRTKLSLGIKLRWSKYSPCFLYIFIRYILQPYLIKKLFKKRFL